MKRSLNNKKFTGSLVSWLAGFKIPALLLLFTFAATAGAATQRIATLTYLSGKVEVQRVEKNIWESGKTKMPLYVRDKVRTSAKSSAEILLDDNSILRLKERSVMEIRDLSEEKGAKSTSFGVLIGKVWTKVAPQQPNSRFEVITASATVGVRGTVLAVSVDSDQSMRVLVFEGSVEIKTLKEKIEEVRSVLLQANQAVNIDNKNLSVPEAIKWQEHKEWTDFIDDMDKTKKGSPDQQGKSGGGVIKYSIKARNTDGKEKETGKYSITVKGAARGETK